jgi:hypothetical protein
MLMISFSLFVVVPENTFFINNERQTVLIGMARSLQWLDESPEHEFRKLVFSINNALMEQFYSFHVGDYNNTSRVLSIATTLHIGNHPCFPLSNQEEGKSILALRSQIATLKHGQHLKYAPYAFTEHGAIMVANVLNSPVAVHTSIQVVRAFIRLREIMAAHKDLAQKLEQMEKKYDRQFKVVFDAIRELMAPPISSSKPQIGFIPSKDGE